jgi:hypothetical protein
MVGLGLLVAALATRVLAAPLSTDLVRRVTIH